MFIRNTKTAIEREYGILGKPLAHSYSQAFFEEKFKGNRAVSYSCFELPDIGSFTQLLQQHPRLCGLNVTSPYKEQIIPFLDELSPEAAAVGAVNVVKISHNNGLKLVGYNTDVYGFEQLLLGLPVAQQSNTQALIFGTGGASKAVAQALSQNGISFQKVSRRTDKEYVSYEALDQSYIENNKLLINTTPLGNFPNVKACPNIPYQYISPQHTAIDLIYNPIKSLFLNQAELKGATIKNGWEMFVYQALKSYEIWEGVHLTHKF